MKKTVVYTLETLYREPLDIVAYDFGMENAPKTLAVVGSTRGNEIQQTYVCAHLVRTLTELEQGGYLDPQFQIRVIPTVNNFSLNVGKRFWAVDNTDINRMFPGYNLGETTQRIADGVFQAVKDYEYGIQLCSFYLPGDFVPHVRVTDADNSTTNEGLSVADWFELPYVVRKKPSSFDTTTLNYNWQVWETKAFSLYSKETDNIDVRSSRMVEESILRFLGKLGACSKQQPGGWRSDAIDEADLVSFTSHHGGILVPYAHVGDRVHKGEVLGEVVSPMDAAILEQIVCTVDGHLFFAHRDPLIYEHTSAYRVVPFK